MNWRLTSCYTLAWAMFFCCAAQPASGAKPRKSDALANARKVDLLQAVSDKQLKMSLNVHVRSVGTLTLLNLSDQPMKVDVPLTLGATPFAPTGANRVYYLGAFGTPAAPQALAVAVNPQWNASVEKKGGRKSNVRATKKKADDDAKDDKKDGDKKDGEKKDGDKKDDAGSSLMASVPLPPGLSQTLPIFALGLNMKKPQATYGPFTPEDLEKVTMAPEIKKVLELLAQSKITADVAQTLAWHYSERMTWDEMATSGFVTQAQLQIAQPFADVVEGKAQLPSAAPATGKKKKRR